MHKYFRIVAGLASFVVLLTVSTKMAAVEIPKPVINIPKPVINVPRPVINVPRPAVVVNVPKPAVPRPAVNVNVRKPVVNVPKPVVTVSVPKPAVVVPKPTIAVTTPKVDVPKPAIVVTAPKVDVLKPASAAPSSSSTPSAPGAMANAKPASTTYPVATPRGGTGQAQCPDCKPGQIYIIKGDENRGPHVFTGTPGCGSGGPACWVPAPAGQANTASSGTSAQGTVNKWEPGKTVATLPDIGLETPKTSAPVGLGPPGGVLIAGDGFDPRPNLVPIGVTNLDKPKSGNSINDVQDYGSPTGSNAAGATSANSAALKKPGSAAPAEPITRQVGPYSITVNPDGTVICVKCNGGAKMSVDEFNKFAGNAKLDPRTPIASQTPSPPVSTSDQAPSNVRYRNVSPEDAAVLFKKYGNTLTDSNKFDMSGPLLIAFDKKLLNPDAITQLKLITKDIPDGLNNGLSPTQNTALSNLRKGN